MEQTLEQFLADAGVTAKFINRNSITINNLTMSNLKITWYCQKQYVWKINNKVILCELKDELNSEVYGKLVDVLKKTFIKTSVYYKLSPFINSVAPNHNLINSLINEKMNINLETVVNPNVEAFLNQFVLITNSLQHYIESFPKFFTGRTYILATSHVSKYIIGRCFDILSRILNDLFNQNIEVKLINSVCNQWKLLRTKETFPDAESLYEIYAQMHQLEGKVDDCNFAVTYKTLLRYMEIINQNYFDEKVEIQSEIISKVYFAGVNKRQERKFQACNIRKLIKRPKVKKLSWRDKRPPPINTKFELKDSK